MSFDLLSVDGRRLAWTNAGPKDGGRHTGMVRGGSMFEHVKGAVVLHENGKEAYGLGTNGGTLVWMPEGFGGPKQDLRPPRKLPELSWGAGLAWDTRQGVLAIVSTGGEGFFYRYDTRRHAWLGASSLQNRDLVSLAHDAVTGTYVGISDDAELVVFSESGGTKAVHPLIDRLAGLRGIPHADGLTVVARGGVVAIVHVRKASVTHIWTYDLNSDHSQLTYKN